MSVGAHRYTLIIVAFLSVMAGCDRPADQNAATNEARIEKQGAKPAAPEIGATKIDKYKIVIKQASFTREQLRQLEAANPEVRFVIVEHGKPERSQLQEIGDADAVLTDTVTPELVKAGKRLRWIQSYAAGVDDLLFSELVDSDITLTNCKIIQGPEIADHGFAMLLALTRRLNETLEDQRRQEWKFGKYRDNRNWPLELNERTALVIGLGGIGMQIAQRAHAFGMKVVAIDPKDIPPVVILNRVYKPDQLHEVLPQADVIFMAAPLTRQTTHMLGHKEFMMVKPGAYFIALSRGNTFVTEALVHALRDKRLAGAGLDVVEPEPLPKGHALWGLPNVIITPHMAGQSDKVWDRRFELIQENVRRFVKGAPLHHVVDKRAGY